MATLSTAQLFSSYKSHKMWACCSLYTFSNERSIQPFEIAKLLFRFQKQSLSFDELTPIADQCFDNLKTTIVKRIRQVHYSLPCSLTSLVTLCFNGATNSMLGAEDLLSFQKMLNVVPFYLGFRNYALALRSFFLHG